MKSKINIATEALRGMVLSLLQHGFTKGEIAAALDKLTAQASRDDWQKTLAARERARGIPIHRASSGNNPCDTFQGAILTEAVSDQKHRSDSPGTF